MCIKLWGLTARVMVLLQSSRGTMHLKSTCRPSESLKPSMVPFVPGMMSFRYSGSVLEGIFHVIFLATVASSPLLNLCSRVGGGASLEHLLRDVMAEMSTSAPSSEPSGALGSMRFNILDHSDPGYRRSSQAAQMHPRDFALSSLYLPRGRLHLRPNRSGHCLDMMHLTSRSMYTAISKRA